MLLLLATAAFGVLVPAQGAGAGVLGYVTYWAVALLFFLYGGKLDPLAVRAGLLNWRLQGLTFGATYLLFPLLGLALVAKIIGAHGGIVECDTSSKGTTFRILMPAWRNGDDNIMLQESGLSI